MAYWVAFAVPVIFICVWFFIFYLHRIYPKRSKLKKKSRLEQEFDLLDENSNSLEEALPENWLELEILDRSLIKFQAAQDGKPAAEEQEDRNSITRDGEVDDENCDDYPKPKEPANYFHKPHKITKRDLIAMLIITAVYAVIAFFALGSVDTPESFASFESSDTKAVMKLPGEAIPGKIIYFTGIGTGHYKLYTSLDGTHWDHVFDIEQKYSELLKWRTFDFPEETGETLYIRITGKSSKLFMGEAALYDTNGNKITLTALDETAKKLLDEADLPVVTTDYLYNSYFDEIYHARTALEHIENIYPYEVSHPPLGKIIIGLGIRLFGMNPFGWRFIGTLFGILMLPILYVFLKNMFGKLMVAICGTLLFAFDFMHFVQTRIATIDTYGVFFILLMFYFMYRYLTQFYDTPFRKTLFPLFLSGLCFGIGAASKWTVIYGGAGLCALYVIRQFLRFRYYAKIGKKKSFGLYLCGTLAVSIVFFVLIPVTVYILSYIPYGTAKGMKIGEGMLFSKDFLQIVWENQKFMFSYHSKLVAEHPYSSEWWKWIINLRPILYYLQKFGDGTKSAFAAFGNPVVWWTGIGAMIAMVLAVIKRRDKIALMILIGYISQLFPWIIISRIAFIYHYFPNVIFIVLGISYMFNDLCEIRRNKFSVSVPLLTLCALGMFIIFFPVLTGIRVDAWYPNTLLRWFDGMWPF
ncbi:MAG: phospholipid carrier-dependent glycosyltransferase [Clostridiales bacterium]|nr:phospholipid carrier-dependent glycosyltransferase [Clostridiales bacterium]